MSEDTNKKNTCAKKYRFTAKEVSVMQRCSESYVKRVRRGLVNTNTPLAQRILLTDERSEAILEEVKRLVTI